MREVRGRYGQHNILKAEPGISMNLLPVDVLTSLTFSDFLKKYKFMIIKPLFGPQEAHIIVKDDGIQLINGKQIFHFQNKDQAYEYVTEHICRGKYYVIQALLTDPTTLSYFYFTLHRESAYANWKVVKSTVAAETSVPDRVKGLIKLWKLKTLLLFAAKNLGAAFPKCHTVVMKIARSPEGKYWLVDTILHDRNSKWSQYHSLYRKRALRPFLPATDLCTKKTLFAFLNTYTEVVIKPCVGQQGQGIVKISVTGDASFEVHEMQGKLVKTNYDQLFEYISDQYLSQKDYIVQQLISLATINGCPFDIRVITQNDEDTGWIVTGVLVKVAAKGYFISNRVGNLLTLEKAFSSAEIGISIDNAAKWIEIITQKASSRLSQNIGELSIIGFDIGVDDKGAIWVIEGNYVPSLSMFYMFDNNEIHERISYYIKKNKKSD